MIALANPIRYGAAFAVPLVVTLLATPVAGRLARRWGILDHPAMNKLHFTATPYLGGVAVAVGLILAGAFAAGVSGQLLTILACALVIAGMGLIDDWRTVGPVVKVVVEVGAGLALWAAGVRAGVFGVAPLDAFITVAWVVTVTNALNLLDNMDGVASGVGTIAALAYFVLAAQRGDSLVASMALAIAGAGLGFLRHNFPPARIFLGDAGSLLIGFLLSALALKLDLVGKDGVVRSAVPVLILAVPLFDLTLVVISRLMGGRRIYVGGTDHSAHRLAALGWSHTRVAVTSYAAAAAFGGVGIAISHLPDRAVGPLAGMAAAVLAGGILVFLRLERRPTAPIVVAEEPIVVLDEPALPIVVADERPEALAPDIIAPA